MRHEIGEDAPEMVKRVARAIIARRAHSGGYTIEDEARAAIEALREPTTGMVDRVSDGWGCPIKDTRWTFRGMISAALGEKPE